MYFSVVMSLSHQGVADIKASGSGKYLSVLWLDGSDNYIIVQTDNGKYWIKEGQSRCVGHLVEMYWLYWK